MILPDTHKSAIPEVREERESQVADEGQNFASLIGPTHRENQVLEAASRALVSFRDEAKAAAESALWNYFVSELLQSATQNLSKKDRAVKTATFFSKRFCEADWRKFRNKEAACQPPWLTDGIDGRGLCTLIFSVVPPSCPIGDCSAADSAKIAICSSRIRQTAELLR